MEHETNGGVSGSLRVELASDLAAIAALEQPWEALNRRQNDHQAPFFQSFAWTREVVKARSAQGFRPLVATIWQGDTLVGIWPLALAKRGIVSIAQCLDDPMGQFAGIVLADPALAQPSVELTIAALKRVADGLHLEAVTKGSALHRALASCGVEAKPGQETVVVDLRPYGTLQEFRQTIGAKTRKNMRNLTNRMRRAHDVKHFTVVDREEIRTLIRETFENRVKWMERNARTSPAFRDTSFRELIYALPDARDMDLIGFAFKTPEKTVSAQWGVIYQGRYYAYMSALNPEFAEFSAGRLHLGVVIESCFDRGIKIVELMPPAVDYKLEWSEETRTLETMSASFNVRGRLVSGLADTAFQTARGISRMLPNGLRRELIRRINKS